MISVPGWIAGVHHDGSSAFLSNPLPNTGETVTLRLRVPLDAPVNGVYLRASLDGESHIVRFEIERETETARIWAGELKIQQPRTEYRFRLLTDEGVYLYTSAGLSRADSPEYYDFVILANYAAPLWVRDSVFYQIFPDRFANGDPSNDVQDGEWERNGKATVKRVWGELPKRWEESGSLDFFGGDLQGVTQNLDYLQRLGVNGIYLTPIFPSASNHRYDVSDFSRIDPHLGGDEALAELRQGMDACQMRLMLDITPNHAGDTNNWFLKALSDPDAVEASFFFKNPATGAYETWLGVTSLLKLNWSSKTLRDWMYRQADSVMRQWMKPPYRIDSWRLDVANMTGNLGDLQLDHAVWQEMRYHLRQESEDIYLLGEYFPDGTPHTQGDELDAAMNYAGFNIPVRRWLGGEDIGVQDGQPYADKTLLPTDALATQYQRFMAAVPYPIALQQFNQLDSHDTTRILDVCKGDKSLVKLGVALMMAFPGVPCIYYGSEIGLPGGKDPDNRRCMPWDESEWDSDLLTFHQQVIDIRKSTPALKHGGFQTLYAQGETLAFLRELPEQVILFAGHRGMGDESSVSIPMAIGGIADGTAFKDLLSGEVLTVENGYLILETHQAKAWIFEKLQ